MKIQAIATLVTAAAVSLFGLPETSSDSPSELPSQSESYVITGESVPSADVLQDSEPDPFSVISEGGHAAAVPVPASEPLATNWEVEPDGPVLELADDGSEDLILDFSSQPDLVDVTSPTQTAPVDSVTEDVESPIEFEQGTTTFAETVDLEPSEVRAEAPGLSQGVDSTGVTSADPLLPEITPADEIAPAQVEVVPAAEEVVPAETQVVEDLDLASESEPVSAPGPVELAPEIGPAIEELNNADVSPLPINIVSPEPVDASAAVETAVALPSTAVSAADPIVQGVADPLIATPQSSPEADQRDGQVVEPTMGQEQDGGGFWLKGARLNEVFQYLARLGGMQYFHNTDLDQSNFVVTGHLGDGDPIAQMEELGLMYGVTVHTKGSTVYALNAAQLAQLPTKPFQYHLKYLRPNDIEQIKTILQPVLTPGSGTVDYETKTNTLLVIDNDQKIEAIKAILAEMDQPKEQIAIETRILRIKSSSRNRIGVDWETILGDGLTITGTEALNSLFNLPDSDAIREVVTLATTREGASAFTIAERGGHPQFGPTMGTEEFTLENERSQTVTSTGSHLVLSPLQLQATLRALNMGGLAQQESSPTLVTEDNEPGIISIIDRIPIIITTITETDIGQNITEDVRYRIDLDDPVDDPATTREVGVSVAVTPTILPDNTIRMALRPRSAQIVEFIESQSGNFYPRVNESTVDTIARVPNGHSLLIGGFYEDQRSEKTNKVPILGDIPGLNFMFKSSDTEKEQTSLVFVVTPKYYKPVSIPEHDRMTQHLHNRHVLQPNHDSPDRRNPGDNYEPNLGRTVGNALNLYPQEGPHLPLHPDHPVNQDASYSELSQHQQEAVEAVQPVEPRKRQGFFGRLFKRQP